MPCETNNPVVGFSEGGTADMQQDHYEDSLISIVIPVYNAAPFLKRTLASVKNQSYQNWELILVDDASADSSIRLIEQQIGSWDSQHGSVRLLKNERNQGPAASRNRGLREARGRYLAYLDADDYWEADKLERQYRFMKEKDCAFSFTGYEFAGKDGIRNGSVVHVPESISYKEALTNTTISTITVMFDRDRVPERLLYMPEDCPREDTATWWQILKNGHVAYGLDEALSVYCRHRGSHSANKLKAVKGTWKMYRKQEEFSVPKAAYYMTFNLMNAVKRRI